jgi:hypothetical protein
MITIQNIRLVAFRERTRPFFRRYDIVVACCKCKRKKIGRHWTYSYYNSIDENVSHTYCPECKEKEIKIIGRHHDDRSLQEHKKCR